MTGKYIIAKFKTPFDVKLYLGNQMDTLLIKFDVKNKDISLIQKLPQKPGYRNYADLSEDDDWFWLDKEPEIEYFDTPEKSFELSSEEKTFFYEKINSYCLMHYKHSIDDMMPIVEEYENIKSVLQYKKITKEIGLRLVHYIVKVNNPFNWDGKIDLKSPDPALQQPYLDEELSFLKVSYINYGRCKPIFISNTDIYEQDINAYSPSELIFPFGELNFTLWDKSEVSINYVKNIDSFRFKEFVADDETPWVLEIKRSYKRRYYGDMQAFKDDVSRLNSEEWILSSILYVLCKKVY